MAGDTLRKFSFMALFAGLFLSSVVLYAQPTFQLEWSDSFSSPRGIGVDHNGNVYVADSNNARVVVYDSNGTPTGASILLPSTVLDVVEGPLDFSIYAATLGADKIKKYDSSLAFITNIGAAIRSHIKLATDSSQNLYSIGSGVNKFDSSGTFIASLPFFGFTPISAAVYDGGGSCILYTLGRIPSFPPPIEVKKSDCAGLGQSTFIPTGILTGASGLAVDASGNVYVIDLTNDQIHSYDPSGVLRFSFGGPGSGPGQFSGPQDLAIAPDGSIFVADTSNHRIQKWGFPPADTDGDGVTDDIDACPSTFDPTNANQDGDAQGDVCDPCPIDPTDTCSPGTQTALYVDNSTDQTISLGSLTDGFRVTIDFDPGALVDGGSAQVFTAELVTEGSISFSDGFSTFGGVSLTDTTAGFFVSGAVTVTFEITQQYIADNFAFPEDLFACFFQGGSCVEETASCPNFDGCIDPFADPVVLTFSVTHFSDYLFGTHFQAVPSTGKLKLEFDTRKSSVDLKQKVDSALLDALIANPSSKVFVVLDEVILLDVLASDFIVKTGDDDGDDDDNDHDGSKQATLKQDNIVVKLNKNRFKLKIKNYDLSQLTLDDSILVTIVVANQLSQADVPKKKVHKNKIKYQNTGKDDN